MGGEIKVTKSDYLHHIKNLKVLLEQFWEGQRRAINNLKTSSELGSEFKNHNDLPLARCVRQAGRTGALQACVGCWDPPAEVCWGAFPRDDSCARRRLSASSGS